PHQLDFRATVSEAAKILTSVTTLRDLLDRFANTVAEAVGADRVFILLPDKQGFSQRYPMVEPGSRYCLELTRDQATITELESNREPIDSSSVIVAWSRDRKSTRLNSSHLVISYAVFCLKKKKK